VEEYNIHPLVAKTFEWEEAPKAFEALINQTAVGKVVIRV
jgi:NADPH:quinone reductase-like Zn-dependent oxidoreductase